LVDHFENGPVIPSNGFFVRLIKSCLDALKIFPADLLVIGDDNAADTAWLASPEQLLQKTISVFRFEML
jgi:hypothetical protein